MPFAALGAGIAAVVAAAFIMLKGGMVEKPAFAGGGLGPDSQGGSAMGVGDIGADGEPLDPFKRFPRARQAGGPEPTQAETQQLYNDTWGSDDGGTSVTYESAGDAAVSPGKVPYDPSTSPDSGDKTPYSGTPTGPQPEGGKTPYVAPAPAPIVSTGGGGRVYAV
jgi:hypothetical protein